MSFYLVVIPTGRRPTKVRVVFPKLTFIIFFLAEIFWEQNFMSENILIKYSYKVLCYFYVPPILKTKNTTKSCQKA